MSQKFFASIGLRVPLRVLRVGLSIFSILAGVLTAVGLITAAAIRNDNLATKLLSHYPRYSLAMDAYRQLQDIKYPVPNGNDKSGNQQFINIAVLSVDDPSWDVMLDFIRSETAVRKSERNQPGPVQPTLQSQTLNKPLDGPSSQSSAVSQILPPINFDRIKTIDAVRIDLMSAGAKPLVPPYNLIVLWPPPTTGRIVYEFLSFEEFRLDLRRMILDEIEEWVLWISVIAFASTVSINALRAVAASAEQRHMILAQIPARD